MSGIVYKATNKINEKKYIGITSKTLNERKNEHIKMSKTSKPKYIFHKAIKKYGKDNFDFEIIDAFESTEESSEKEKHYINQYDTFYRNGKGYNMTLGGEGTIGHMLSEESIIKIKNARSKQIFSEETRKLWSEHRKGRKLNHGWKISKTAKETGSHKKSDKTKEKLRLANLGKKMTEKQRIKMIKAVTGIPHRKLDENIETHIITLHINGNGINKIRKNILQLFGIKLSNNIVINRLKKANVYKIHGKIN